MITQIGARNDKNVENADRLSKFNYCSRANYSIQTAILEKLLMCNLSVRERKL